MPNRICWTSCIETLSKGDNPCYHTSFGRYSMVDMRKLTKRRKALDSKAGRPRRKYNPMTVWILDELLDVFFEEEVGTTILKSIHVKDTRGL